MRTVREVIIVEGKYDINAVRAAVGATVIATSGFQIFSNSEKICLIRTLAEKRGVCILTDSDSSGFLIRNHLKGMLGLKGVKHAYIPDIPGRERRKSVPSKEGKLGVEGMTSDVIISALERAGVVFEDEERSSLPIEKTSKADLYFLGLSGRPDSAKKRAELSARLGFPAGISANALLEAINILFTKSEFITFLESGIKPDIS